MSKYADIASKAMEGEWIDKHCSICGGEQLYTASGNAFATTFYQLKSKYCPTCGAKMKKEKTRGNNNDERHTNGK